MCRNNGSFTLHGTGTGKDGFITGRNEVLAKVIFSEACVILSTGGGGSGPGGGEGGGLVPRGVSKFSGGSPIFRGGGVATGIRSTFGRYASYWNAFLYIMHLSVDRIGCTPISPFLVPYGLYEP